MERRFFIHNGCANDILSFCGTKLFFLEKYFNLSFHNKDLNDVSYLICSLGFTRVMLGINNQRGLQRPLRSSALASPRRAASCRVAPRHTKHSAVNRFHPPNYCCRRFLARNSKKRFHSVIFLRDNPNRLTSFVKNVISVRFTYNFVQLYRFSNTIL